MLPPGGTQWWLETIGNNQVIPGSEVTPNLRSNWMEDRPDQWIRRFYTYNAQIAGLFMPGGLRSILMSCETPAGVMEQEASYRYAGDHHYVIVTDDEVVDFRLRSTTPGERSIEPSDRLPTPD